MAPKRLRYTRPMPKPGSRSAGSTSYHDNFQNKIVDRRVGSSSGTVQGAEDIWGGGRHLGSLITNGNGSGTYPITWSHVDWLGTERARTSQAGSVTGSYTSLPYGDALAPTGDADPIHFTGKERDAESGNDYFGARYYASTMGRFMSPDPENFGANIMNPQSWNMYSYAMNNPLINFDPDGRECVWDDGSYDSKDDPDSGSADKCGGLGGTWISNDVFENSQYYRGDWSGDANGTLGGLVGNIQSCSAAVGGGQAASLIVADAFASGFSNDQTAYALGTAAIESGPGGIGTNMTEIGSPSYFSKYDGTHSLGNNSPGDGYTYRGRGYVQLTGRWNYNSWTNQIGQHLVQHPSLAATPDTAAEIWSRGWIGVRLGRGIPSRITSIPAAAISLAPVRLSMEAETGHKTLPMLPPASQIP